MNFDSSPVQNDHQVLSVRSNKQGCNQLFGFNNVKRNNSTQLDSQNLQPDSTFGSRLGSIRGLADRIKRFYSMQFDDQVRKGAVTSWNWCVTSGHISSQMRLQHIVSHILVHAFVMFNLTGLQHHFQADDDQFISQARIEAVNRRCDSYNKMLIVSILIFNAIIIAFITFLFFFPFQKYELWTISLTVYMQFKSFIHRWKCKRKLI